MNIKDFLDNSSFSVFHWKILFWTSLIIVFDGYDLVIYGSVLPLLMKNWGISPLEAGSLASYAMIGMMIGAFFFGSFGNRIGTKISIIICILLFSIFTVLCGFSESPLSFGIFRFIAGLGIGGVMPNTVSLMAEYSPKKIRNSLITAMFSGIAIGGIFSVLVGMYFIPHFGWQAVFYFGIIPIVLLPIIIRDLPESMVQLIEKKQFEKVNNILKKIDSKFNDFENIRFSLDSNKIEKGNFKELFTKNRRISTILFWFSFFFCLLIIYGINSWLPKLIMSKPEYQDNLSLSLTFLMVYNIGAVAGAIIGGRLGDKINIKYVVVVFFIFAALSIGLLGFANSFFLYILIFIAGATTSGNQIVLNSLLTQYYPIQLRNIGFGWALGIGRMGAIVGPSLVGLLVSMKLTFEQNFFVFSIAATLSAIAILFINFKWDSN